MKKIITILLAGLATLFFTACGSSGGGDSTPPPAPITVNLIGTWDYMVTSQGSVCDGMLAQGIEIIEPLNGDTTLIGNILLEGTDFALDGNLNCYITPIDIVTSRASGFPSTGTIDDYLRIVEQMNAGDNTIASIRVDSFNNYKIVTVTEYTNGVIATSVLTR